MVNTRGVRKGAVQLRTHLVQRENAQGRCSLTQLLLRRRSEAALLEERPHARFLRCLLVVLALGQHDCFVVLPTMANLAMAAS